MRAGALIEYRLRLHGVPVSWLTRIEEWDPAPPLRRRPAEEARTALWHRTHEFEPDGDGGTLMRDTVRYALPYGPLGEFARRLFVARDLAAIFDFRADARGDVRSPDGERALHALRHDSCRQGSRRGESPAFRSAVTDVFELVTVSEASSTPLPSISTACGVQWTGCRS